MLHAYVGSENPVGRYHCFLFQYRRVLLGGIFWLELLHEDCFRAVL